MAEAQQQRVAQICLCLACNSGLKTTPQGCHLTVPNHAKQHVGNSVTQKHAQGQDFPLERCLLAYPGFQSNRLHQPGLWAPKWHRANAVGDAGKEAGLSSHAVRGPICKPRVPTTAHALPQGTSLGGFTASPTQGNTAQGCTTLRQHKDLHCWGAQHGGTQNSRCWGAQGPVSTRVPRGPFGSGDPKPGRAQHRGTPV